MIGYTKVWKVNGQLVVSSTIEEAIKVYQDYYKWPYNEIEKISLVEFNNSCNALIRKENKS